MHINVGKGGGRGGVCGEKVANENERSVKMQSVIEASSCYFCEDILCPN